MTKKMVWIVDRGFKRFLKYSRSLAAHIANKGHTIWHARVRRAAGPFIRSHVIKSYLGSHPIRKLQIGAGPNVLKGWLNTDRYSLSHEVVFLDATEPFPFQDDTFNYIFGEHFIETLAYSEGLSMLRECYRILKPGGRIRIATPDLKTLIDLYSQEKDDLQGRYIRWITNKFLPELDVYSEVFVINNAFRDYGHHFLYDRVTLQSAMKKVGFVDVISYAPGESDDENLRGIESHGKVCGDEDMNRFETMVLEAKRPNTRKKDILLNPEV